MRDVESPGITTLCTPSLALMVAGFYIVCPNLCKAASMPEYSVPPGAGPPTLPLPPPVGVGWRLGLRYEPPPPAEPPPPPPVAQEDLPPPVAG